MELLAITFVECSHGSLLKKDSLASNLLGSSWNICFSKRNPETKKIQLTPKLIYIKGQADIASPFQVLSKSLLQIQCIYDSGWFFLIILPSDNSFCEQLILTET